MNDLKGRIEELGKSVKKFVDPFGRGWHFPLDVVQLEEARAVINKRLLSRMSDVYSLTELVKVLGEEEHIKMKKDDVSLAARLYDHDLVNVHSSMNSAISEAEEYIGQNLLRKLNKQGINQLFVSASILSLFALTMAYIASGGNKGYRSDVSIQEVEFLLGYALNRRINFTANAEGTIKNLHFVALYQLVKNARRGARVSIKRSDGYLALSVQDSGRGILDENGAPMPKEKIPDIFNGYSIKKDGGLGLMVVKRILELYEGHVEVTTTTPHNPTIGYSTKSNRVYSIIPRMQLGTKFDLFIPNR